jgi:uncharacterized membrane protein
MNKSKTTLIALYTILLGSLVILAGYVFVYHSYHFNESWNITAIKGAGLFSAAILQHLWFDLFPDSRWNKFANFIAALIILLPTLFGLATLQSKYYDEELEKHGVLVGATVVALYEEPSKNSTREYAKINYTLYNKTWVQKLDNEKHQYKPNDSLTILCSSRQPEIIRAQVIQSSNTLSEYK